MQEYTFCVFLSNKIYFIDKKKHTHTHKKHTAMPLDFARREEIAHRRNGGQSVRGISEDMGVSKRSVYRLLRQFEREDGMFEAQPMRTKEPTSISREQLIVL